MENERTNLEKMLELRSKEVTSLTKLVSDLQKARDS